MNINKSDYANYNILTSDDENEKPFKLVITLFGNLIHEYYCKNIYDASNRITQLENNIKFEQLNCLSYTLFKDGNHLFSRNVK